MTAAQYLVYSSLQHEQNRNGGWPVTVRRLQELTGHASPATVHRHLELLQAAGVVERGPYVGSGFRVPR